MTYTCTACHATKELTHQQRSLLAPWGIDAPDLCFDCGMRLHLAFRNERALYVRKCDATGKEMVTRFGPDNPHKFYENSIWYGDSWDPTSYGKEYDPSRSFFDQLAELSLAVPRAALGNVANENSPYVNETSYARNCHLCFAAGSIENCVYGNNLFDCKDSLDLQTCESLTSCYECIGCGKSSMLFYSEDSHNCANSSYLFNCTGCRECYGCVGLRHQEYCILNRKYTKEEYEEQLRTMDRTAFFEQLERLRTGIPRRYANIVNCEESTGNMLINDRQAVSCFDCLDSENTCESIVVNTCTDVFRLSYFGTKASQIYNSAIVGINATQLLCCVDCYVNVSNLQYCISCTNGTKDCFGCVGMHQKQYCILNKQYSQEEYERLQKRIIEDMRARGEYGRFFPASLSPFTYDETIAQHFYPLRREEAKALGFTFGKDVPVYDQKDRPPLYDIKEYADAAKAQELTTATLYCEVTGKPYKIVPQELAFYLKHSIQIPRKSPDQRHLERLAKRPPRKLWDRQCMNPRRAGTALPCTVRFMTPYAPDRPEQVWCASCFDGTQ